MDLDRRGDLHAKGFILLPTPEETHRCDVWKAHRDNFKRETPTGSYEQEPVKGTVWQCPDCGRYWIVRDSDVHAIWVRMRWYHKEAKIIRRFRAGK